MNMKLNFPHIKRFQQGPTDDLCGVKCLQSIYGCFNLCTEESYFLRNLSLPTELAFMPQLMRLMVQDGFNVNINISNPNVFDLTWKQLSNTEIIGKLTKRFEVLTDNKWKRLIKEYVIYLSQNNAITQEVISEKLLQTNISSGAIILAFVDNVIFHQRGRRYWDESGKTYNPDDIRGGSDGHTVIINGWDEKKGFHIIDPSTIQSYSNSGIYWIASEVLIAGVYSFSGEIAIIRR